jgi:hypothetical protein
MSLDEVSLGLMSVDKMSLDEMTGCRLIVFVAFEIFAPLKFEK